MDKLTAIKIKYDDGTYSDEIPVSVLSENVEWDSTHTLVDVLGSIDVDVTGTIQDQISQLFNEKVSATQLQNYVASQLNEDVSSWLNTNVNPVGSAVVVDSSLTISGAAADAKIVGDNVSDLKSALNVSAVALSALNEEIPFRVTVGQTIIVRSKDGSKMTPDYIRFYDKLGSSGSFMNQYSLSEWSTNKRTITFASETSETESYYCALINGTAQDIIIENLDVITGGTLYEYEYNAEENNSEKVLLDTLGEKKEFYVRNGDLIYVKSVNGEIMTPTIVRLYFDDGTNYEVYINDRKYRKYYVNFGSNKIAKSISINGGTAQSIIVHNLSFDRISIAEDKIKSNTEGTITNADSIADIVGKISVYEKTYAEKEIALPPKTSSVNPTWSAYFPVISGHKYAAWLTNADGIITINSSNDGINDVEALGHVANDSGNTISTTAFDATQNAKMLRGVNLSTTNAVLHVIDVSALIQIRTASVIDDSALYPFIIKQGEGALVYTLSGDNFTPTYLDVYDENFNFLTNYTLAGWNTNKRTCNVSLNENAVYYISLRGNATAKQKIGIIKIRTLQSYSDEVNEKINHIFPVPTSFNSSDILYRIDPKEKAKEFTDIIGANTDTESFLFFTDPHTYDNHFNEYSKGYAEFLQTLVQKYYHSTPTNFVLCGGDWLQDADTISEAKYKLGLIESSMKAMVNPFYNIVGNHDTNYQGVDGTGAANTGMLDNDVIANLWFSEYGKNYYKFEGANTVFYVFDSGLDWTDAMDAYRWNQLTWFANSLLTETHDHIAVGIHIWLNGQNKSAMAGHITDIINAFNTRTSVSVNNVEFNYSGINSGRIEFVVSGHNHQDFTEALTSGVPVIGTINAGYGNNAFDLIFADYTAETIKCVRVGTGSNRGFSLSTGLPLT